MATERQRPAARAGVPFGPLTLRARVAMGPRAEVFRARLGRQEVACKRLLPHLVDDAEARQQLQVEAAILRVIPRSAEAARWIADDVHGARPWLATAWTVGLPLSALLDEAEGGAMETEQWTAVRRLAVLGLWRALSHLHAAGWIHGDLSARNALCRCDGRVVLIDLAAALPLSSSGAPPRSRGTARYAAPEVAALDRLLPASDVFAAAALSERLWPALAADTTGFLAQLRAAQGAAEARPTAASLAALARTALRATAHDGPWSRAALRATIARRSTPPQPTAEVRPSPIAAAEADTPPDDPTATRVVEGGWAAFAALAGRSDPTGDARGPDAG